MTVIAPRYALRTPGTRPRHVLSAWRCAWEYELAEGLAEGSSSQVDEAVAELQRCEAFLLDGARDLTDDG